MSLEDVRKENKETHRAAKAAITGAVVGGAIMGGQFVSERAETNAHMLSPAAIIDLKEHHAATDNEIAAIDVKFKQVFIDELARMRQQNQ